MHVKLNNDRLFDLLWDSLGIEKAIWLWVLLRNLVKNDSSSSDEDRSSQNPSPLFPSSSLEEEHEESLCLGIFKADNWLSLDFSSEIFSISVCGQENISFWRRFVALVYVYYKIDSFLAVYY